MRSRNFSRRRLRRGVEDAGVVVEGAAWAFLMRQTHLKTGNLATLQLVWMDLSSSQSQTAQKWTKPKF